MVEKLYTDGGLVDRNPSRVGGTWAWVGVNANDELVQEDSGVVPAPPGREITNNHTEQIAIVKALEAMPDGWSGVVCSDSQIALGRVFMGWATKNLAPNIIKRTEAVMSRMGDVTWELLQGHPTKADLVAGIGKKRGYRVSKWNVKCDEQANARAKEFLADLTLKNNTTGTVIINDKVAVVEDGRVIGMQG